MREVKNKSKDPGGPVDGDWGDVAAVALLLNGVVVKKEGFLIEHDVCSVVDDIFYDGVHCLFGLPAVVN